MGTVFHKTDRLFVWVAFMVLSLVSPAQDLAVGHWRTHFAPSAVIQMAQRDVDMFGAMESSLLYVDTRDDILYEMDRTDDLSGVGISALAYGALYDALVVGYSDGMLVCRSEFESPEVDGEIFVRYCGSEDPASLFGKFITVKITEADEYDLKGEIVSLQEE